MDNKRSDYFKYKDIKYLNKLFIPNEAYYRIDDKYGIAIYRNLKDAMRALFKVKERRESKEAFDGTIYRPRTYHMEIINMKPVTDTPKSNVEGVYNLKKTVCKRSYNRTIIFSTNLDEIYMEVVKYGKYKYSFDYGILYNDNLPEFTSGEYVLYNYNNMPAITKSNRHNEAVLMIGPDTVDCKTRLYPIDERDISISHKVYVFTNEPEGVSWCSEEYRDHFAIPVNICKPINLSRNPLILKNRYKVEVDFDSRIIDPDFSETEALLDEIFNFILISADSVEEAKEIFANMFPTREPIGEFRLVPNDRLI